MVGEAVDGAVSRISVMVSNQGLWAGKGTSIPHYHTTFANSATRRDATRLGETATRRLVLIFSMFILHLTNSGLREERRR